MITSKQELRQVSERMSSRIKADMRTKIVEFLQKMGTSQVELANALDITVNELNTILEGNGEITLTTFAKILVASNHSLEIRKLPENSFGHRTPNRRREPMQMPRSNMRGGERIPSFEEFNRMVREGRIPPPPRGMEMMRGDFTPHAHQHVQETEQINQANCFSYDSLTRDELIAHIVGLGLSEEFVNTTGMRCELARRSDMINFLNSIPNEEVRRVPFNRVVQEEPIEPIAHEMNDETHSDTNEIGDLANAFAQVLSNSPELREMFRRIL